MVEFSFNIKLLFPDPITVFGPSILPDTYQAINQREKALTENKYNEIIDKLGELSQHAQRLQKPITSAKKLKQSRNQSLYILADTAAGKNGKVCGFLKVGTKTLFLCDKSQNIHEVSDVPCILDFYVHESLQHLGNGKRLFDEMLDKQNWKASKCVLDMPSKEMMGFLKKHYGLEHTVPQRYNVTLFEEFYDEEKEKEKEEEDEKIGMQEGGDNVR